MFSNWKENQRLLSDYLVLEIGIEPPCVPVVVPVLYVALGIFQSTVV